MRYHVRTSGKITNFQEQMGFKLLDRFPDSLWHFFRASELQQLAESCGLTTLEIVGCEGLSTGLPVATNTVAEDPTKWERWIELVLDTATEPAVVDMAAHILYIGRVG